MSDDNEPQGPSNPFIRFKNHVNARIGTGVSVFTGTTDDRDRPLGNTQASNVDGQNSTDHHGPAHTASLSPWPSRNQSRGSCRRRSGVVNYWDDWCHVDPYSPHNLQHLPQPTPKDLPSGADPADFGFPEAFEDLMSASNPFRGHLMDLGMRAGLKKSAAGKLVQPETPSAWVRRLYGDALLPPPFIWEQPRLAGGITWVAHGEQPAAETVHRAQHGNDDIGDVARAYLEFMRQIDGRVDESFSKFEEIVGRDMAEMMRKGQKLAEKAMGILAGERSEDHEAGSSQAKTHDGAKPASASEEDQPVTEEDLFELIQSASAGEDKFLNDFAKIRARRAPPPSERTTRDTPPAKETVEYDPSGGKTIRTSSEHVDMFGFIHSRTEVRRLNAKGETVDYDTRYSVRSSNDGSRGDRARQGEYSPRVDAPVSVLMTPEQYTAFIGKSSDEQLESFQISMAEADEAALDPDNLALKNRQMQLILQEQQRRARSRNEPATAEEAPRPNTDGVARGGPNHALQDYQMQLMLLEQQNKRRLRLRAEAGEATSSKHQDYQTQLRQLEQQNKERLMRAREQSAHSGGERTLQDHEAKVRLLEEQNREWLRRAREEAEAEPASDKPQEGTKTDSSSGWFWR
ncbi:hypothetical protein INS49_006948 [Diaporthe citri]|uniref:uncharacterized protein n=1 Tax=Diaporthe citri TaxID=83186 RepID=UPI001C81777B|nr:uncharacterized protein INS49_006948 [Diaporthe citri]KAG6365338.1 hypothetical protein INS49_006948 [Diaporthe citri]